MPGRQMKEYVRPSQDMLNKPSSLAPWIEKSIKYVSELPPKVKKTKK